MPKKKVRLGAGDVTKETVSYAIPVVEQLKNEVRGWVLLWNKDHQGLSDYVYPNRILEQLHDWLCRYEAGLAKAQTQLVETERNSLAEIIEG